jgi:benzoyl-CoA 2,3-dioxygenase component B
MFVGETGIGRVIQRTCEAMRQAGLEDPYDVERVRGLGVIDLPTIQKKANLHFSLSLDLFGSEISTNAANAFNAGIKGRHRESKLTDDHRLIDATYPVLRLADGKLRTIDEPALTAINARLRDDYVHDCAGGIGRWNKMIARTGIQFEFKLPHVAFNRRIGEFATIHAAPDGRIVSAAEWAAGKATWLPSPEDGAFIESLMRPEYTPARFAAWIAPPRAGVDNKPGEFEYVKIAG